MLYNAMLQIKWLDYLECIILQTLFQLLHWNQSVIQRRQNPSMVGFKLNSDKTEYYQSKILQRFSERTRKIVHQKSRKNGIKTSLKLKINQNTRKIRFQIDIFQINRILFAFFLYEIRINLAKYFRANFVLFGK